MTGRTTSKSKRALEIAAQALREIAELWPNSDAWAIATVALHNIEVEEA